MLGPALPSSPDFPAQISTSASVRRSASGLIARTAATLMRRPYGLIVHDLFGSGALQTGIGGGRVSGLLDRVERANARSAERLLVLTEGFRDFFVDGGFRRERIDVVPPWTHSSPIAGAGPIDDARAGSAGRRPI